MRRVIRKTSRKAKHARKCVMASLGILGIGILSAVLMKGDVTFLIFALIASIGLLIYKKDLFD